MMWIESRPQLLPSVAIKSALPMTLIKTSLLNAIAVAVKMLTMLGLNKLLAVYVGPAGYAAVGQFQNAVQMITVFGSGAINTGVTKYTAEYHEDEYRQRQVWQTAGSIVLICSLLCALLIALFNRPLAQWFLQDKSFGGVFLWFAATLVLFVFNALLLAILNGKKEVYRYVLANIAGSLFSLSITTWLAISWGLYGALVALAIYQSIAFFVTLMLCYRAGWFQLSYLLGKIDRKIAKNLGKYALMALTSAICVPLSHIFVRNHLGDSLGWEVAGYWEAMWRLSAAYLMVVTTTLSVYYLPRLSELHCPAEIKREILHVYKIVLPVAILCSLTVFVLRDWLVGLLFTSDFMPMRELFGWQMVGDTLKIASWILAFVFAAKAFHILFIVSEVLFAGLFYASTVLFTNLWGFEGVAVAHAFVYLIYFLFVWTALKHKRIL